MARVKRGLTHTAAALFMLSILTSCKQNGANSKSDFEWITGPAVGKVDLLCVAFSDDRTAWAVGDISPAGDGGAMFQTTDAGLSWRAATRTTEILTSLSFVNVKTGWVAGYAGRIERTTDGGVTWNNQRIEHEGEILNSILFFDDSRGYAVGADGLALRTSDGGGSWQPMNTGQKVDLWAVRFSNPDTGWLVGEDGMILATTDGGQSWSRQNSGTTEALTGLAIGGPGIAVAVGAAGTILRKDGAYEWQHIDAGISEALYAVAASGPSEFCAVGARGTIICSKDLGQTWQNSGKISGRMTSIDLRGKRGIAVGRQGGTSLAGS